MVRITVTDSNLTPLIQIIIWLCLIIAILTVLVRLSIKFFLIRRLGLDDLFIVFSLLFSFSQSITVSIAAKNGLGKPFDLLDASQTSSQSKARYSAAFLFIASACFAKLSLVIFLRNLTPIVFDHRAGLYVGGGIILWALTAILGTAFQCHLPKPWDYLENSCFNRTSWEHYVAIMNILTDVSLVVLPMIIVGRLKAPRKKKAILLLTFMGRICVIAAVICQLIYLNRLSKSSDPSLDFWPVTICIQLAQCLSIVTACSIYLKPFLDSMESGFIQVGDLRRKQIPGFGYSPQRHAATFGLQTRFSRHATEVGKVELQGTIRPKLGNNTTARHTKPLIRDVDGQSHILKTTTWIVQAGSQDGHLGNESSV